MAFEIIKLTYLLTHTKSMSVSRFIDAVTLESRRLLLLNNIRFYSLNSLMLPCHFIFFSGGGGKIC